MFLVQKRCDDGIQSDGLALSCSTGDKEVWLFCEVDHEHLVRYRLAESDREFHRCLLKLLRVQDGFHRHDARLCIRHLDAYCAFSGYRGDDAYSERSKRECDVIFKTSDF